VKATVNRLRSFYGTAGNLAAGHVWPGNSFDGTLFPVFLGMRKYLRAARLEEKTVLTWLTSGVTVFMFIYLWVAMIRPEKF
jgi:K+-transporting ATPase KdpF subunit